MYLLYPKNSTWRWLRSRPQGPKNIHTFLMTVRPLSWACGHGTKMLLILKKKNSTWLSPDIFRYRPKKCPTILYAVNLWLKPVSATGATVAPAFAGSSSRSDMFTLFRPSVVYILLIDIRCSKEVYFVLVRLSWSIIMSPLSQRGGEMLVDPWPLVCPQHTRDADPMLVQS